MRGIDGGDMASGHTVSIADLASACAAIVGPQHVFAGADIEPRYRGDAATLTPGDPALVVRPGSTAEIADLLALCHERRQPVVVQGGRTGLAWGARPLAGELALSLERLTAIEELDPAAATATVQAGVVLQRLQEAAEAQGFSFPLDIGGRGSCTIGGLISTNAGGNRVIRYGMTRDMVLGLEVVLADGTVLTSLNKMIKNNAGYDLKQLFIGSEGTLGVVTRAVVRLRPAVSGRAAALVALRRYADVVTLLRGLERRLGGELTAFEAMWDGYYRRATALPNAGRPPLPVGHPIYVLIECTTPSAEAASARLAEVLAPELEAGLVVDAVVAQSGEDTARLWRVRDAIAEMLGGFHNLEPYDISVPTGAMGALVDELSALFDKRWPIATRLFFGHVGDSNLHVIVDMPSRADIVAADREIYAAVGRLQGSVSAEHGIGMLKRDYLAHSRGPAELELMRRLKRSLDPRGILNRGRVVALDRD